MIGAGGAERLTIDFSYANSNPSLVLRQDQAQARAHRGGEPAKEPGIGGVSSAPEDGAGDAAWDRAGGGAAVSLLHLRPMPAGGEHGRHPARDGDQQPGSFWEEDSNSARRGDRGIAAVFRIRGADDRIGWFGGRGGGDNSRGSVPWVFGDGGAGVTSGEKGTDLAGLPGTSNFGRSGQKFVKVIASSSGGSCAFARGELGGGIGDEGEESLFHQKMAMVGGEGEGRRVLAKKDNASKCGALRQEEPVWIWG